MTFQRNKLKNSLEKCLEEWLGEIQGAYFFPEEIGMPEFLLHNIVDIIILIWESAYNLQVMNRVNNLGPIQHQVKSDVDEKPTLAMGFKTDEKKIS